MLEPGVILKIEFDFSLYSFLNPSHNFQPLPFYFIIFSNCQVHLLHSIIVELPMRKKWSHWNNKVRMLWTGMILRFYLDLWLCSKANPSHDLQPLPLYSITFSKRQVHLLLSIIVKLPVKKRAIETIRWECLDLEWSSKSISIFNCTLYLTHPIISNPFLFTSSHTPNARCIYATPSLSNSLQ